MCVLPWTRSLVKPRFWPGPSGPHRLLLTSEECIPASLVLTLLRETYAHVIVAANDPSPLPQPDGSGSAPGTPHMTTASLKLLAGTFELGDREAPWVLGRRSSSQNSIGRPTVASVATLVEAGAEEQLFESELSVWLRDSRDLCAPFHGAGGRLRRSATKQLLRKALLDARRRQRRVTAVTVGAGVPMLILAVVLLLLHNDISDAVEPRTAPGPRSDVGYLLREMGILFWCMAALLLVLSSLQPLAEQRRRLRVAVATVAGLLLGVAAFTSYRALTRDEENCPWLPLTEFILRGPAQAVAGVATLMALVRGWREPPTLARTTYLAVGAALVLNAVAEAVHAFCLVQCLAAIPRNHGPTHREGLVNLLVVEVVIIAVLSVSGGLALAPAVQRGVLGLLARCTRMQNGTLPALGLLLDWGGSVGPVIDPDSGRGQAREAESLVDDALAVFRGLRLTSAVLRRLDAAAEACDTAGPPSNDDAPAPNFLAEVGGLARLCTSVDYYVVYSSRDSARAQARALRKLAEDHGKSHGGEAPVVWLRAACADAGSEPADHLRHLAVHASRARYLAILVGPGVGVCLLCAIELFAWLATGGRMRHVRVVPAVQGRAEGEAAIAAIDTFHVATAGSDPTVLTPSDSARIDLAIHVAGPSRVNEMVRRILPMAGEALDNFLADTTAPSTEPPAEIAPVASNPVVRSPHPSFSSADGTATSDDEFRGLARPQHIVVRVDP